MNRKELFESAKRYVVGRIAQELGTAERKLPTVRQLAELAGCSYGTMRLVMAELEKEGFVRQRQGSGTYISERPENWRSRSWPGSCSISAARTSVRRATASASIWPRGSRRRRRAAAGKSRA